ncbi:hypothetical protein DUI87_05841 [Hirundo rustica rustica]|uniref:Uncharacterized protein n=1 Tax=Hirundo rustica rustica TaxID=333673 RepID=A0A3M0KVS9_HIRRU|nr:hypothetical protein DUI87_05841 [Hirundo rustica rustica]
MKLSRTENHCTNGYLGLGKQAGRPGPTGEDLESLWRLNREEGESVDELMFSPFQAEESKGQKIKGLALQSHTRYQNWSFLKDNAQMVNFEQTFNCTHALFSFCQFELG